jgi:hypothetical protein
MAFSNMNEALSLNYEFIELLSVILSQRRKQADIERL